MQALYIRSFEVRLISFLLKQTLFDLAKLEFAKLILYLMSSFELWILVFLPLFLFQKPKVNTAKSEYMAFDKETWTLGLLDCRSASAVPFIRILLSRFWNYY